jgi:hypothetical protein
MTDKEAMAMALDALEYWDVQGKLHQPTEEAIIALKARLAQPHETTLKEFNQLIHDDPKYHTWAKEKALQSLHDENERLGLYKDAYAEPESECNPQDLCAGCRCKYAHVQPEQEPVGMVKDLFTSTAWAKLIQGVRVDGDTVVIKVKGGNDAARELCGALIEEINK